MPLGASGEPSFASLSHCGSLEWQDWYIIQDQMFNGCRINGHYFTIMDKMAAIEVSK